MSEGRDELQLSVICARVTGSRIYVILIQFLFYLSDRLVSAMIAKIYHLVEWLTAEGLVFAYFVHSFPEINMQSCVVDTLL